MSSSDPIFDNYASGKQTFIIPLTFTDINDAKDIIERIGYGGDIWEVRVDLLSPEKDHLGETNIPPLSYVKSQIEALQSMSHLPILFTIRTKSQGGKFPDDANQEALKLMLLAFDCGIAYVDVEIEWPEAVIQELTAKKNTSKIVASYHSWTGKIRWTSDELKNRFEVADKFGDIIKMSILSATIEDTYELGLFVRDYKTSHTKPLLAVGMGANGQLSRITSPISLVTHPRIPFPSAPGQLSLAQVHKAQNLIGQLPVKVFHIKKGGPSASRCASAFEAGFQELGYPYVCTFDDAPVLGEEAFDSSDSSLEAVSSQFTKWTGRPAPVSVMSSYFK
ncbi:3-dehydroquinate dehydratase (3-dehydroquinase) [Pestalotiopsis sp. 9143b]|nr:3-dehydroquinate dehydratase (3-dehydroquinase) [Pestalotiopsis sp. 9143b]